MILEWIFEGQNTFIEPVFDSEWMMGMAEVGPGYTFFDVYQWLRRKIVNFAPGGLSIQVGKTAHYGLPDFRLVWHGIRIIGMFPRPTGVELLLEYDKFLRNREFHDSLLVDRFEDAAGALIVNKNRLLVLRSLVDLDEEYVDTYLKVGMILVLAEVKRIHPGQG